MKKFLLSLLIITAFNLRAQTIPNNSYETWTTYPGTSIQDPVNWGTSNMLYYMADLYFPVISFGGTSSTPQSAFKESPGNSGSYALKLQNVIGTITVFGFSENDTLPGMAQVYTIANGGADSIAGVPVTATPASLIGYYKFNQGSSSSSLKDTAAITVKLTKWNSSTSQSDSIGYGELDIYTTASAFTAFTVNIVNISGQTPDTAQIEIISSINTPASPNSYIIVDDLAFSGVTGITPIFKNQTGITLYPNPVSDYAIIKNLPKETASIQIVDFTGKKVTAMNVNTSEVNISTSSLTPGIYYYNAVDANGSMLYSSKFTVAK